MGAMLSGASTGFSMTGGNPIGAVGGAAVAAFMHQKDEEERRKREAKYKQDQLVINSKQADIENRNKIANFPTKGVEGSEFGYLALGGDMKKGFNIKKSKPLGNGAQEVTGDKHNQDTDGDGKKGVPVMQGNKQVAEVEQGEVEYEGYVFSDRIPEGKSFAEMAKQIIQSPEFTKFKKEQEKNQKVTEEFGKSKYLKNSAQRNLQNLGDPLEELFMAQEQFKEENGLNEEQQQEQPQQEQEDMQEQEGMQESMQEQPQETPMLKYGGKLTKKYALGGNLDPFKLTPKTLDETSNPFEKVGLRKNIHEGKTIPFVNNAPQGETPKNKLGFGLKKAALTGLTSLKKPSLGKLNLEKPSLDKVNSEKFNDGLSTFLETGYRFADNFYNRDLINKASAPPTMKHINGTPLKTTMETGAQQSQINSESNAMAESITRNLKGTGRLTAALQGLQSNVIKANNELAQNKSNVETQLKNAKITRLNQEKAANLGIDKSNLDAKHEHDLNIAAAKSGNVTDIVNDFTKIIQDKNLQESDLNDMALIIATSDEPDFVKRKILPLLPFRQRAKLEALMKVNGEQKESTQTKKEGN